MEDTEERLLGSRPLHRLLLRLHRKQLGRGRAQLLLGGGLAAGVCLWRGRQRLGPGMSKNTTPAVTASSGSGAPGVPEPACHTLQGTVPPPPASVPEELEAHSLPVSRSLSPSLVSARAGVFEQDALTTWCLRRRLPEHLERGLCSAANSLAPSCKQSRAQGGWHAARTRRKALGEALLPPREGRRPVTRNRVTSRKCHGPASCLHCTLLLRILQHRRPVRAGSLTPLLQPVSLSPALAMTPSRPLFYILPASVLPQPCSSPQTLISQPDNLKVTRRRFQ